MHWQGYTELVTPRLISSVKRILGHTAHIDHARGTPKENIEYCSKVETAVPGTREEFGKYKETREITQGRRTDLDVYADMIHSGVSVFEIVRENPAAARIHRYLMTIQAAYFEAKYKEKREVIVYYIYGRPGVGKSRYVHSETKSHYYAPLLSTTGSFWFDNYNGQDTLVLDEVDLTAVNRREILQILDVYPLCLNVKGSCTYALWTTVYITSNQEPPPAGDALRRRITYVVSEANLKKYYSDAYPSDGDD